MSLTKQQVTALYIAVYNRAPDAAGLEYWSNEFEGTYTDAAAGFVTHPVFAVEYGDLNNQARVEKFYTNILGATGDTAGVEYWASRLDAGEDISVILAEFLDVSLNGDFTGDVDAIARQDTLKHKVEVGIYYAVKMGDASNMSGKIDPNSADIVNDPAFKAAEKVIAGVNNTLQSVRDAKVVVDDLVANMPGETYHLTVGQDVITATDNADIFKAYISQNLNGQQVNTLGSGDRLDGGAGNDTLQAEVTQGAFVGGGNQQIQPKTVSVENIVLQSVASHISSGGQGEEQQNNDKTRDQVYVNAKDMLGVNYIGSERSNANLTITDLTSKDNDGDMRDTADMTVGMKYTGNGNSNWKASDLNVLFDQDYLTRDIGFSRPAVDINVMNEDAYDETGGELPLAGVFLRELTITVNGQRFDLTQYLGEDEDSNGEEITTYAELLTAVQNAIVSLQNANPDNAALQTLEAKLNGKFFADIDPETGLRREGDSLRLSVSGESDGKKNTLEVESTDLELARTKESAYANNNRFERADNEPAVESEKLVAIKVQLEKAGLAGDGGELVIGSMNKGATDANTWNPDDVNTVGEGTVSGVEQFNVKVSGNKSQSSSLAGMRSTNNNLREVYVESVGESDANLTIGNSNTHTPTFISTYRNGTVIQYVTEDILTRNANALKDVRIFDASDFNGDLHLQAALTCEVTEKYLANDQGDFAYSGGKGNDSINLAISAANLATAGTATHGDFALEINGGGGHDTITVGIYGLIFPQTPTPESIIDENGNDIKAEGLPALAAAYPGSPWYENQKTNANLNINAGDGNDTVNLLGSGDWIVDLGAGNDVIYVANGGPKSSWIFNATTPGTYHYENGWVGAIGGGNPSYNLYKVGVLLTFDDHNGGQFELGLVVEPDMTSPYKTSQKAINEAIKKAIESDNVFSKLIEAKTGQMAQTLIIDSLVDGETELKITFEQLPLGANQIAIDTFNSTYGSSMTVNELAQAYAKNAALATTLVDAAFAHTGYATGYTDETFGAQVIEAGKGDDVLVLGTSEDQTHSLVYNDFDNGKDTILNFTGYGSGSAGAFAKTGNQLDLSSYDAEYVDFGFYTGTTWNIGGANNDLGGLGALAAGDTFLRVNEQGAGVYTIEAWKTSVAGDVTTDANIEKLGTVGTLDFGGNISFAVDSFIF